MLLTQVIIPNGKYQSAKALQDAGKYEEAIAAYALLDGYSDSVVQIMECKYRAAKALQDAGKYEEAIAAYAQLNGYSDSAAQITACENSILEREYRAAKALQEAGKYEEAIAAYAQLNGYSDSAAQITECEYQAAKALQAAGKYAEAYATYSKIKGYKDVDSLLVNDHNLSATAAARDAKYGEGNYVTFGHYPQTSGGKDNTPIEWLVLARDGNRALLLSRYGLEAQPYTKEVDITWEKSTVRAWLNGTFLNKAFTAEEQEGILLTNVDNGSSQGYSKWSTSGGNNTQDRVFLLSYAEANMYLGVTYDDSKNTRSRAAPTAYALKQGAYTSGSTKTADGSAAGRWWLRSPGCYQSSATFVYSDGSLTFTYVFSDGPCVRPALWVNLESEIF